MKPNHFPISAIATRGFSLIEVAISIGIISIALVPLIALIPVGLSSMKGASEQAAAATCVSQIAESLLTATQTSGTGTATGAWAGSGYLPSWPLVSGSVSGTIGASSVSGMTGISLGGVPTSVAMDQRLQAHVIITTSSNTITSGTAFISVAWPNNTRVTWNDATKQWDHADGSISSWVILPPQQ